MCLVMATNQNSGIDVFFGAEFNFRVQIPDFRRAHHYKISKNHFSSSQHQKFLFTVSRLDAPSQLKTNVLKACVTCFEGVCYGNSAVVYLSNVRGICYTYLGICSHTCMF